MRATKCRHMIGPTYQSVDTQTSCSDLRHLRTTANHSDSSSVCLKLQRKSPTSEHGAQSRRSAEALRLADRTARTGVYVKERLEHDIRYWTCSAIEISLPPSKLRHSGPKRSRPAQHPVRTPPRPEHQLKPAVPAKKCLCFSALSLLP